VSRSIVSLGELEEDDGVETRRDSLDAEKRVVVEEHDLVVSESIDVPRIPRAP
jgi:hypothetical protein